MRTPTLAIDFGTSNSAAAIMDGGKVRRLLIEAGSDTLPTAVFFAPKGGAMRIGEAASAALICGEDGLCYEAACEPDCTNKVCGEDGCGGDCGICASPKVCVSGGCALGPCGTIDAVGECQGEVAVTCVDLVNLVEDDCEEYEDLTCAYDGWSNTFSCIDVGPCMPQCEGKVCGSDG